jgi:hypothetical protein
MESSRADRERGLRAGQWSSLRRYTIGTEMQGLLQFRTSWIDCEVRPREVSGEQDMCLLLVRRRCRGSGRAQRGDGGDKQRSHLGRRFACLGG